MNPSEGEVYTNPNSANEVLIDNVMDGWVYVRVTDGEDGLIAARRMCLAEWHRVRESHELTRKS